jgi:hypothetical protein
MGTIRKHSKYKNPGILFELLVRQITADMIANQDSKAVGIIKKFFTGTELLKEYNLYNTVIKASKLSETKAESLVNIVVEESKKLDNDILDREKYKLIKEIKKYYDVENFFKAKIENYKLSAAVYTLFESARSKVLTDTKQLIESKTTILEHITKGIIKEEKAEKKAANQFLQEDQDIRILAYKLIVEKYNETYKDLSADQKDILKEYIGSVSHTTQLKDYLNKKLVEVKSRLNKLLPAVEDKVLTIKLKEVISLAKPILERQSVRDEHVVSLMQYYELEKEIKLRK